MEPSPLFDDPRLTTASLFFEAHDGLLAKLEPSLAKAGLSFLDFNALMRLSRAPGGRLRMSELASQTLLSTSGVTRVVDRLQRAGLVLRESSPDDRRSTYAVLTPEGEHRLLQALADHLDGIERWFTGLYAPRRLRQLTADLRTLRDAVHPDATTGSAPPPTRLE